ncbi:MAG: hypothetical protein M3Y27_30185 [Acidobacteriota bacterium]|nr:hypothetical protein [Acidobacteriota bacterium]
MTRLPNWQSALANFERLHREDRFAYGSWDCCLFVCDVILCMTGVDPAADFRGRYATRAEALARIRNATGTISVRKIAEHVTARLGMPRAESRLLQRGDLALIRRGKRDHSLGIVALSGLDVMVVSPKGLMRIPMSMAVSGWRI